MKRSVKMIFLSLLLIICYVSAFTAISFSQGQDPLQIDSAEITQDMRGNYKIILLLNQERPEIPDDYFEILLKNSGSYILKEKVTGVKIDLSKAAVQLSVKNKVYQIILRNVDITHRKKYAIEFKAPLPLVDSKSLEFRAGEGSDDWEKHKSAAWTRSVKPKISQGESSVNDLGDLGIDLSLNRKLSGFILSPVWRGGHRG